MFKLGPENPRPTLGDQYAAELAERQTTAEDVGAALYYPPPANTSHALRNALIVAAILIAVLYFAGTFDKLLASSGLNAKNCVVTGMGDTKCGEEAEILCSTYGGQGCRDAGFSTFGSLEDKLK